MNKQQRCVNVRLSIFKNSKNNNNNNNHVKDYIIRIKLKDKIFSDYCYLNRFQPNDIL